MKKLKRIWNFMKWLEKERIEAMVYTGQGKV